MEQTPVNEKDTIKNIGNKLAEDDEAQTQNKDMASVNKELEDLNKISNKEKPAAALITIKEKDIETLKNELDVTYEEAKAMLIRHHGDLQKAVEAFLNDFKFSQ